MCHIFISCNLLSNIAQYTNIIFSFRQEFYKFTISCKLLLDKANTAEHVCINVPFLLPIFSPNVPHSATLFNTNYNILVSVPMFLFQSQCSRFSHNVLVSITLYVFQSHYSFSDNGVVSATMLWFQSQCTCFSHNILVSVTMFWFQ